MTDCLREYLKAEIRRNSVHLIKCPDVKCELKPSEAEIKQILGVEFTQYEKVRDNLLVG
jgi:hypothetical protein